MGEIAFYHRNHVVDFLQNVHGANNSLQKATLSVCRSNLVMTECKVPGSTSKIITGPLWRLIEKPDRHVFGNEWLL